MAGLTASFAIAAALVDQRVSGRGRRIDVSLLESTLAAMGWVVSNHQCQRRSAAHGQRISPQLRPARSPRLRSAEYRRQQQKQYGPGDIVERPDLKADRASPAPGAQGQPPAQRELEAALQARPAAEWDLFNAKGVPVGCALPCRRSSRSEQVVGRRFVETLSAKVSGGQAMRVTRPGFRLEQDFPAPLPPPQLGQDTERWLGHAVTGPTRRGLAPARHGHLRQSADRQGSVGCPS
jgi:crotonobetainyl-CoA:carnitine CoA-transferase CaiB-like acyl-CoA transferase